MTQLVPQSMKIEGALGTFQSPASEADDEKMRELLSDVITMQYLLPMAKVPKGWTLEEIQERRMQRTEKQVNNAALNFHIYDKKNAFVGCCGFNNVNFMKKEADFGIILHHTYWKKKFATEAHYLVLLYGFNELDLQTVIFNTAEDNTPMQSFYNKFHIQFQKMDKLEEYNKLICEYILTREMWIEKSLPKFEAEMNLITGSLSSGH